MKKKVIPKFKNLAEERAFWQTHDTTEYLDWKKAKRVSFPNLKPSTETISLRLPKILLQHIKQIANEKDVPYQSYIKMILSESIYPTHKIIMNLSDSGIHARKKLLKKKTKS